MARYLLSFIFLYFIVHSNKAYSKTNLSTFASIGSNGIGLGCHLKEYSLFCRYYYTYQDDPTYYVYYHFPSITLTHSIFKENKFSCYSGINYSVRFYRQKYFFSGTWNFNNFSIGFPVGMNYQPFDRFSRLSFLLESGIQLEHLRSYKLRYDWQLGLANFTFDIRYRL
jgi:hypothetical protein